MLCNIDDSLIEDARRILTLLCFAVRPLKVRELIDAMAVEIGSSTGLNRRRRLQDAGDIRRICPGLIDIEIDAGETCEAHMTEDQTLTVRIAHFSVQEYLESHRIRDQKAAVFGLFSVEGNAEIAQICLIYLLEHDLSYPVPEQELAERFPLARFAARYWVRHYPRHAAKAYATLDHLVLALFLSRQSFTTSVRLFDMNSYSPTDSLFTRRLNETPSPVLYASCLGLKRTLPALMTNGQEANLSLSSSSIEDADLQDVICDSPLQAASINGHLEIVQTLLENGADINAQGGRYGNSLQAASLNGHYEVVRMLVENGADINAQGGRFGNALRAASDSGHDHVVQLLLEHGADIHAQGEDGRSALQAASTEGWEKVVQILLERGAEINTQGGLQNGNALQTASFEGHYRVVQMLLEHGAATDLKDKQGRCPFHSACAGGYLTTVKLVSSFTRDWTVIDGQGRNGLHHAAMNGSAPVVMWLLQEGFSPNEADQDGWTPLHWAAKNGSADTIQVLSDASAACTAESINGWTPESVALFHDNDFPSTLQKGADPRRSSTYKSVSCESTGFLRSKLQEAICDGCDLVGP